MSLPSLSRRRFLSLSATLSAGIFVAPAYLRSQSPNSKLNFAFIGVGGKGGSNMKNFENENVVAICDVDSKTLGGVAAKHPQAKSFRDYRKLFDELKSSEYDAVVISTPDHHHYLATVRALQGKKHVYCEKPLTHTIGELREIKRLSAAAGVATQMGNHGNASEDLRLTSEIIQAGLIGDVTEVHAWSNRPVWPQGVTWPTEADPVPENLDWDLWLGPAEMRPYFKDCHPFKWRGFWDFGTGAFGDMGCHILNWPYTALGLGDASHAECLEQEGSTKDSPPKKSRIQLTFPARGKQPGLTLTWHDGGLLPAPEKFGGEIPLTAKGGKPTQNGSLFIGTKGILFDDYDGQNPPTLLPTAKMADFKAPEKTLPRSKGGHFAEFIDAIKGGPKAGSDFVTKACGLTELALLGYLAARVGPGKKLEWDAVSAKVKNAPETEPWIRKAYRDGWKA